MSLNDFIKKYQGKTRGYPEGKYVGECLSLVKVYIKECFNIDPPPSGSNSAYGYWSNFPNPLGTIFEKVENTLSGVPAKGDIPIWNTNAGGGFGHIAIFVSGDTNAFTSFDQNWGGKQAHLQTHDYTNVVGWLTPKQVVIPEPTEPKYDLGDLGVWERQRVISVIKDQQTALQNNSKTIMDQQRAVEILNDLNKTLKQQNETLQAQVSASIGTFTKPLAKFFYQLAISLEK